MTRRRIFVARHGETDWNRAGRFQGRTDVALNATGRAQAADLAERARGLGIAAVAASDLSRARDTAAIVGAALGVPLVHVHADLRERGYGVFEGKTREECEAGWPDAWQAWATGGHYQPPDAEPREELVERLLRGFERVRRLDPEHHPILVVSHGGAIRTFVEAITGARPSPVPNAAVFEIEHDDAGWQGARMIGP